MLRSYLEHPKQNKQFWGSSGSRKLSKELSSLLQYFSVFIIFICSTVKWERVAYSKSQTYLVQVFSLEYKCAFGKCCHWQSLVKETQLTSCTSLRVGGHDLAVFKTLFTTWASQLALAQFASWRRLNLRGIIPSLKQ